MAKKEDDIKVFSIRMTKDIWMFLKHRSASKGLPMTEIIVDCVDKLKQRVEKQLTKQDTLV